MFKAMAVAFATVVSFGACRTVPAQAWRPVPVDLEPDFRSEVRPLLDSAAFDPAERKAVAAVAAAVQQSGGSPAEQFVFGPVERSFGTLRIEIVHARDLGPECRDTRGD